MPEDDLTPETLETWIGDYVCSNRRMQRLVETSINVLAEQDRRLYNLIHRYSRSEDVRPDRSQQTRRTRQTRDARHTRQTNLDNYLRPTSNMFAGARVVGQQPPRAWTTSPNNFNFVNPFPSTLPRSPLFVPNDFLNPVAVRPTEEQIAAATHRVTYGSIPSPLNTSCPITQTEFLSDDNVVEILHCHHVFSESAFNQWFRQNVHCPLCRYDIRNYSMAPSPNDTSTTDVTSASQTPASSPVNPQLDLFAQVTRFLQAGLSNSAHNMPFDSSGNLTFSYNLDIQGPD